MTILIPNGVYTQQIHAWSPKLVIIPCIDPIVKDIHAQNFVIIPCIDPIVKERTSSEETIWVVLQFD